jgi:hypothetical protein
MIESLYAVPEDALEQSRAELAYQLIDVPFDGLRPRMAWATGHGELCL